MPQPLAQVTLLAVSSVKLILDMEFMGFSPTPSFTENVLCGFYLCMVLVALGGFQGLKKLQS